MFDPVRLAKLSSEQLEVAKQWESDRSKRLACLDRMEAAEKLGDTEARDQAYKEYRANDPTRCAHDRSMWSNCGACLEIQKILFPENFEDEDD